MRLALQMSESLPYIDTCGFIDLIKYGRGHALSADAAQNAERLKDCWFLGRLCDASRDGAIWIVTSILTISECVHIGDATPIDQPTRDLIVDFLSSGKVVDLAEADIFIAERARSLWWDHNIRLKGADGIHVATAIEMRCTEFITTDARIRDQANKFGKAIAAIRGIGLNVIRATDTAALPQEYRTDDLFAPK
jgi:hypothetical protein